MFEQTSFIKGDLPFAKEYNKEESPCIMFRKKFNITKKQNAAIYVCGLGYGYYYINGKAVTADLFTAPVSDYTKTLWYNKYDVTDLLVEGENILAVLCGNGFYNEPFKTSWEHDTAPWRDNPKFILNLEIGGQTVVSSDNTWKFTSRTPVVYNELRSGEYFDSRLYEENWNKTDYDDSDWKFAKTDDTPPTGIFRECKCEPIRECEEYKTRQINKTGDKKHVFDIGQNISGYIRLKVKQKNGDRLVIRYSEQIHDDFSLNLNDMFAHYRESEFMTDRFICNGGEFIWKPKFVYHGFRYIEITGIENPAFDTVTGIFVHQDVKSITSFESSDKNLDKLFRLGQMATWSNLFYMPTDCPTREKLGWANDAQSSTEQMLTNFTAAEFLKKWFVDVVDSMNDEGAIPGIIPSSGWGYKWGNGPVSEGILFEIPQKIYQYTGDKSLLIDALPHFKRHIEYLDTRCDENGMINYGLDDWACPNEPPVPVQFVNTVLLINFLKISKLAASFAGDAELEKEFYGRIKKAASLVETHYMNSDGTCKLKEQTAVAMIIFYDLYENLAPLKTQLKKLVEDRDFHHNCGMVGLRRLYIALNKCGLEEYAYKIITSRGYPSYMNWVEGDATTLWELWQPGFSKNHHMYSDFMSWMMKTLVGINIDESYATEGIINIAPCFIPQLDYCKGHRETGNGSLEIEWKRENGAVELKISVPCGVRAIYKGSLLSEGVSNFIE